ncbi:MAG: hypothetical protein M1835_004811 [Candelina submexicana]|nr:MAG: hypothetical protein M1835_004811 [Candelina submexicana]
MPEIGEVARIVSFLRRHLAGKTISSVKAQDDNIIYGKVGTTAAEFQKAITGKKVVDARQQGKYFWIVMSSPPHPVLHFGMSGWMKFSNDDSSYYKPTKEEESTWPPKYWKFILQTKEEPKDQVAFVDARRLGRIRLLDCAADAIRQNTPLKENGPDPVIDKDILTEEWLVQKMRSKKVPVKALLLDQANISGVGNWVGDEVLYHAKIHPEQYSNTLTDAQLSQLHTSLIHICTIAVETLADSTKFPEEWLMRYRWGKGKKDQNKLPNGEKIVFIKVGGRTSAVVPSVQKKTGPVAGDVKVEDNGEGSGADEGGNVTGEEHREAKPNSAKKGAASKKPEATDLKAEENGEALGAGEYDNGGISDEPEKENLKSAKKGRSAKKRKAADNEGGGDDMEKKSTPKKAKGAKKAEEKESMAGRRRSGRTSAKG